jgi:hypothetical protein
MAFQFPANPTVGQIFNPATDVYYVWNGTGWVPYGLSPTLLLPSRGENRIINGKFAIDQRNAGVAVSVSGAGAYSVDHWAGYASGAGAFTLQRVVDATYPGEFTFNAVVTTADASLAAADSYIWFTYIESYLMADLNFGSAVASPLTISFDVESNITGTFPISVRNGAATRSYVSTFTVNVANTRETKTIVIPGDTTGTWGTYNTLGAYVSIGLGCGSTTQAASANTWSAGNFTGLASMTNLMGTLANGMKLRNFRAYKGSVDLGVDTRLLPEELDLCQRYYQMFRAGDVIGAGPIFRAYLIGTNFVWLPFNVPMRTAPTMSVGTPTYSSTSAAAFGNIMSTGAELNYAASAIGGYLFCPWTATAEF